jgi:hypothetical protein
MRSRGDSSNFATRLRVPGAFGSRLAWDCDTPSCRATVVIFALVGFPPPIRFSIRFSCPGFPGRRDGVVDFKVTEGPQLSKAVFEDRLDDPQPIVPQIGSMSRGHVAKNIQSDCGLCPRAAVL